jgi:hypothetical protein
MLLLNLSMVMMYQVHHNHLLDQLENQVQFDQHHLNHRHLRLHKRLLLHYLLKFLDQAFLQLQLQMLTLILGFRHHLNHQW